MRHFYYLSHHLNPFLEAVCASVLGATAAALAWLLALVPPMVVPHAVSQPLGTWLMV
jgi:hypothetical protein